MTRLSAEDFHRYRSDGLLGPYRHPLVAAGNDFTRGVLSAIERAQSRLAYPGFPIHEVLPKRLASGLTWFKSAHLVIPELWTIAEHPCILDRVTDLLGPDVMWWGAQVVTKGPGDIHGWHYDAEYELHDGGVLVWIGLDGVESGSALHVISRTQKHHRPPAYFAGVPYGPGARGDGIIVDEAAVLELAQSLDATSSLVAPPMETGDFMICDGHLWHGSKHEGTRARTALTLHFSKPSAEIRIPLTFDAIPVFHTERPRCAMIRGTPGPRVVNPIVDRPNRASATE